MVSPGSSQSTTSFSDMETSVEAVEKIIKHQFKNKKLLEEALTHSSLGDSPSYERLEFFGDAVLQLAVSKYLFAEYPNLDPNYLTRLRSVNTSNERLARVAVRHDIYPYVRQNAPDLTDKVREFYEAANQEDDIVIHGGSVKPCCVLPDIVESIIGAVHIDVDYDLEKSWLIVRDLLEPMVTLDDLKKEPQPVTRLYEYCAKAHIKVDIKRSNDTSNVYVDGEFFVSGSNDLDAAKKALLEFGDPVLPANNTWELKFWAEIDDTLNEIKEAKQKLCVLCRKKQLPKPEYSPENESGPPHEKKVKFAVEIDGIGRMIGEEKAKKKHANNSAASLLIRSLKKIYSL
ncbi:hypothetical protein L6164_031098 [Bauhinia variegata]|uniref:Uncharacterized protein n=1 Tax=Bauhinia variegata TaxID=167791 RepID=A0ACB9LDZ6_BAUVA|nr:hypothetical protein L6164_031098 [Bauhinia variegata]